MNTTPIGEALDRLASFPAFVDDWDDVLDRAEAFPEPLVSSLSGVPPSARASGWRQRRYLALPIAFASLVVVATGAVLLINANHGRPRSVMTLPRGSALPGARAIRTRVLLALSGVGDDVSHVTTALPNSVQLETWIDPETGDSRSVFSDSSGNVTQEIVETYSKGIARTDDVRFPEHRWSTTTRPEVGPPPTASNVVDELRRAVSGGEWVVVGPEMVDGVAAIHLRHEGPGMTSNGVTGSETNDLWVDASTYRPIKETLSQGSPATGESTVVTSQVELIGRTPENLAELTLSVPAGFAHERQPLTRRGA